MHALVRGQVAGDGVIGVDGRERLPREAGPGSEGLGLVGGSSISDGGRISQRGTFLRE